MDLMQDFLPASPQGQDAMLNDRSAAAGFMERQFTEVGDVPQFQWAEITRDAHRYDALQELSGQKTASNTTNWIIFFDRFTLFEDVITISHHH
jgi:hypothetical protein